MRAAIDILSDARSQGLELSVLDGGLAVRPLSRLSPELRSELKARKSAILALLLGGNSHGRPVLTPTPGFDWLGPYSGEAEGIAELADAAAGPEPPITPPARGAACRYHFGEMAESCIRCGRVYRAHLGVAS